MTGDTNGVNFDRRIRAAAAYAEVFSALQDQNDRLFGNDRKRMLGELPSINAKLDRLASNPFIALGWLLNSVTKVLAALVLFLASLAGIIVGVVQVGHALGWWR